MFTICILFSDLTTKHWIYVKEHQNNSQTPRNSTALRRTVEIPGSVTVVEPCTLPAMFGSLHLFLICGLVKIRQTCKVDICRLVNNRCDFFSLQFFNCNIKRDTIKSTFWNMNALVHVAKFTASKLYKILSYNSEWTRLHVRRYKPGNWNDLLTCLDYDNDKITFLGLQNYTFGFLNTVTLYTEW